MIPHIKNTNRPHEKAYRLKWIDSRLNPIASGEFREED